jgi:hypothetical protein
VVVSLEIASLLQHAVLNTNVDLQIEVKLGHSPNQWHSDRDYLTFPDFPSRFRPSEETTIKEFEDQKH